MCSHQHKNFKISYLVVGQTIGEKTERKQERKSLPSSLGRSATSAAVGPALVKTPFGWIVTTATSNWKGEGSDFAVRK